MSDINIDFTVANIDANFTVATNEISFTPTDVQLTLYTGGFVSTATGLNADISNVHISGGTNGYVLQTDGTGNLSWTAQSGGGGNGTPGGSNTQIQYNNSGLFAGNVGFTFNSTSGNVAIPGNLAVTGNINGTVGTSAQPYITSLGTLTALTTSGNVVAQNVDGGNLVEANYFSGDGSQLTNLNASNITNGTIPTYLLPKRTVTNFDLSGTVSNASLTDETLTFTFSNDFAPGNVSVSNTQGNITNSTTYWYQTVTYGNGKFVSVAKIQNSSTSNTAVYSTDGVNWTTTTLPASATWTAVGFGNNKFVALSASGGAYSADGINWTGISLPSLSTGREWTSVTFGNNMFVAVAGNYQKMGSDDSVTSNQAIYSYDGVVWYASTLPATKYWTGITYGNGLFVAVSYANASGSATAATSPDGINWTQRTLPHAAFWSGVSYGNGLFVAISAQVISTSYFATSPDGITWTTVPALAVQKDWSTITYGNGLFVVVAGYPTQDNAIGYSTDGVNWILGAMPNVANYASITYGNNLFVTTTLSYVSVKSSITSTLATYYIELPGFNAYPYANMIWSAQPSGNTLTQAQNLANTIINRRSGYTVSYSNSNTATIDTNSVGKTPNTVLTTSVAPSAGNLTLSLTKGGGDCVFVTDTNTRENYGVSANRATYSTYAYVAEQLVISQLLTQMQASFNSTNNTKSRMTFEDTTSNQLLAPTITVLQGANSTLTASSAGTRIIQ